jgi:DNA-binding Lrp family transcriptional regulator
MTQVDRDRLVALKKAKKKLITQKAAAEEIGISERQVRRLLKALKRRGDKAVVHALRGLPSNRKIGEDTKAEALRILAGAVYRGVGPTMATESLSESHAIDVSRETLRKWMIEGKLWRARRKKVERVHGWRPRRSRYGELVQWDTSEHDWLEGRGEDLLFIQMIDDATSQRFGRFVRSDSTLENMNVLEQYLRRYGRPLAFYTDKASLFQTTEKRGRDEAGERRDPRKMPPTQIERALTELGIAWIPAHSAQAKGRVERSFGVAQDRLVKGMRLAGVTTLEQANRYLEEKYLPWCNTTLAVAPASADDAHRRLEKRQDLAAILSHVESRKVMNDYTVKFDAKLYQIARNEIRPGLRGATVRVERRRDGSVAVRFRDQYLTVSLCQPPPKVVAEKAQPASPRRSARPARGSDWNKNFDLNKAPKIWQAAQGSGARTAESR